MKLELEPELLARLQHVAERDGLTAQQLAYVAVERLLDERDIPLEPPSDLVVERGLEGTSGALNPSPNSINPILWLGAIVCTMVLVGSITTGADPACAVTSGLVGGFAALLALVEASAGKWQISGDAFVYDGTRYPAERIADCDVRYVPDEDHGTRANGLQLHLREPEEILFIDTHNTSEAGLKWLRSQILTLVLSKGQSMQGLQRERAAESDARQQLGGLRQRQDERNE